jgi:hypothetical protein
MTKRKAKTDSSLFYIEGWIKQIEKDEFYYVEETHMGYTVYDLGGKFVKHMTKAECKVLFYTVMENRTLSINKIIEDDL